MNHTISPAYGRDYTTAAQAIVDWNADKDFTHECGPFCPQAGGRYLNKSDVKQYTPNDTVTIRYAKLRKSVRVP